jgi:hypothetical protein
VPIVSRSYELLSPFVSQVVDGTFVGPVLEANESALDPWVVEWLRSNGAMMEPPEEAQAVIPDSTRG